MYRLFVALKLPDCVCTELVGLQGHLPGFKWVPVENYHLSLQFLGETTADQFTQIAEALDRVPMRPIRLHLGGLGCFGPADSPRVLWVGADSSRPLTALYQAVRSNLRKIIRLERRKFIPHVTLARAKQADSTKLHRYLQERAQSVSLNFEVDSFHLFSSNLRPQGVRYQIEYSYPALP